MMGGAVERIMLYLYYSEVSSLEPLVFICTVRNDDTMLQSSLA